MQFGGNVCTSMRLGIKPCSVARYIYTLARHSFSPRFLPFAWFKVPTGLDTDIQTSHNAIVLQTYMFTSMKMKLFGQCQLIWCGITIAFCLESTNQWVDTSHTGSTRRGLPWSRSKYRYTIAASDYSRPNQVIILLCQ